MRRWRLGGDGSVSLVKQPQSAWRLLGDDDDACRRSLFENFPREIIGCASKRSQDSKGIFTRSRPLDRGRRIAIGIASLIRMAAFIIQL
jgi:hypothetical protein